jgi:two-component system cell cycle response regulator
MRVLAAEDNPVFQSMLRTMLAKWGYRPIIARDGNEAWTQLACEDPPRLAVLDWMMPGLDGVEICRRLRLVQREPYIYILLLTARTESQRIRAGRRILDLQDALRRQATHDGLTGLLNRNSILGKLQEEVSRAGRSDEPLAVIMVDLDNFKSVNDSHGHLAGDAVLREAASRLKNASRAYDAVGRYGGEEFLVVLPGCSTTDACAQAERIRSAMAATPVPVDSGSLPVTASFGLACTEFTLPSQLIRAADAALYQAKDAGRNCVRVAAHLAV